MSFNQDIKEEMIEMKEDIKKLQSESLAYEMLHDMKKQNKRLFVIWIITFIAFIGLLGYTIYLLNDIETIETTEYNQEITDFEIIENSSISNGGN